MRRDRHRRLRALRALADLELDPDRRAGVGSAVPVAKRLVVAIANVLGEVVVHDRLVSDGPRSSAVAWGEAACGDVHALRLHERPVAGDQAEGGEALLEALEAV